jgi:hypothetical protein
MNSILFFLAILTLSAQKPIDFNTKRLQKEISRCWTIERTEFTILTLGEYPTGKYFQLMQSGNTMGYVYIGRVNSCRTGGCAHPDVAATQSTSEYFDYFVLFNNAKAIVSVVVFNYAATYGHQITARGWLKQFIGFNGEKELTVGKNIDAISGATISVNGITVDIQYRTNKLKQLLGH